MVLFVVRVAVVVVFVVRKCRQFARVSDDVESRAASLEQTEGHETRRPRVQRSDRRKGRILGQISVKFGSLLKKHSC